jgi:hypothetical protein
VYKVCIKISQEICGGGRGKVFFGLTALGFIKLNRKALGSINNRRRQNRIEKRATALKSFFDTGINKPTTLQRTINPKEECLFYIVVLRYQGSGGAPRGGLVLKDQDLFYRIAPELDTALIPCGQIVFKN